MKWQKTGRIYEPRHRDPWRVSHAQHPVVDRIDDTRLRVYFSTRDSENHSVVTYIEIDADEPSRVLYEHDAPVLGRGELGCFDDGGAMPSWILDHGGIKYLYYIGWNAGVTVPYRNAIGLAISDDGGHSFTRRFAGPVVDRTRTEPQFVGGCCMRIENGLWQMWYLSCTRWIRHADEVEPVYHLKYAESDDGLHWRRANRVAIELRSDVEGGLSRPCVLREPDGRYRMWYSVRGLVDYRTELTQSYRIGTAISDDGIDWTREDAHVGIDVSEHGWDSEQVAYAHVYEHRGRRHMLYNGNGFGKSGFGHAVEV